MGRRQESGIDLRGNSKDRKARKLWFLSEAAGFGGDGFKVPCVHCAAVLGYDDIEADRIIPGKLGGRYTRNNVQPACRPCNLDRSDNINWVAPVLATSAA